MSGFIRNLWILAILMRTIFGESKDEFLRQRSLLSKEERLLLAGGNFTLNAQEQKINTMLMDLKNMEVSYAMKTGIFPPALHFVRAKKYIEQSEVFKVIRAMPKGAVLHVHDAAMTDVKWLIRNATYQPNCYTCFEENGQQLFHFFHSKPPNNCDWILVTELRNRASSKQLFDEELYRNLTIVDDSASTSRNQTEVWNRFENLFTAVFGMMTYVPLWRDYFYQALEELYEDNVQYVEIRALLPKLYELDGSTHPTDWTLQVYLNTTNRFLKSHSDFLGAKIIRTASRMSSKDDLAKAIQETLQFHQQYPDFVAGFDLVGREDTGHSLMYYLDQLLQPSQQNTKLPYFFHAGETDWEGTDVDENLLSALLLNASRVGHAYALTKHPLLKKLIRERSIAVEISPISNQVLKLVDDLRNHPGSVLLAEGYPVVISSDDPSLWGATGLSYDMYEAFMGLGGDLADLATLKQLAMNSIRYSAMSKGEKAHAMTLWLGKWNDFVKTTIDKYNL